MSNRRRLDRERLEVYFLYLLLRYRQIILISGGIILLYAISMLFWSLPAAFAAVVPAASLLMIAFSYHAALYTARFGAWVACLWRRED